jgi:3-hydroxyacyl-[acyl-carrier-protein] dehydratase
MPRTRSRRPLTEFMCQEVCGYTRSSPVPGEYFRVTAPSATIRFRSATTGALATKLQWPGVLALPAVPGWTAAVKTAGRRYGHDHRSTWNSATMCISPPAPWLPGACPESASKPASRTLEGHQEWLHNAPQRWRSTERVAELEKKTRTNGENLLNAMDIHEILEHLPHRYPFLLVDRCSIASRQVDPCLQERDDQRTLFCRPLSASPGDAGGADHGGAGAGGRHPVVQDLGEKPDLNSLFFFVGIDKARFKKTVTAGDQLHLHVRSSASCAISGSSKRGLRVDGEIVAEAELMCAKSNVA